MDVTTNYNSANIAAVQQNRPIQPSENGTTTVDRMAVRRQMVERPAGVQTSQDVLTSNSRVQGAEEGRTVREDSITEAMLERAFEDANRALDGGSFSLSYSVHEGSNRIVVRVHEARSREVLREIPMESRLDIYARITEFVGLLFDQGN